MKRYRGEEKVPLTFSLDFLNTEAQTLCFIFFLSFTADAGTPTFQTFEQTVRLLASTASAKHPINSINGPARFSVATEDELHG